MKTELRKLVLVLDSVRSKENVGALFRTADAAGVEKVVLCGITPQPVNRFGNVDTKIAKSALGAECHVPWSHVAVLRTCVENLKKDGYTIVVLEQTATSVPYTQLMQLCGSIALVVGNEVSGVSPAICTLADVCAEIPMLGIKESLNVTTATGIALFEIRKGDVLCVV